MADLRPERGRREAGGDVCRGGENVLPFLSGVLGDGRSPARLDGENGPPVCAGDIGLAGGDSGLAGEDIAAFSAESALSPDTSCATAKSGPKVDSSWSADGAPPDDTTRRL